MSINVFKTPWKETLLITSAKIFFTDFGNTLRKCKIKGKRFRKFQNGCFSEKIAMLNFIWKGRDSDRSREKEVLFIDVLESNRSKNFLKVSN